MTTRAVVIRFQAEPFATAGQAVGRVRQRGRGEAIRLQGEHLVVSRETAERLAAAGVCFAHLCDQHGTILTVPVNG